MVGSPAPQITGPSKGRSWGGLWLQWHSCSQADTDRHTSRVTMWLKLRRNCSCICYAHHYSLFKTIFTDLYSMFKRIFPDLYSLFKRIFPDLYSTFKRIFPDLYSMFKRIFPDLYSLSQRIFPDLDEYSLFKRIFLDLYSLFKRIFPDLYSLFKRTFAGLKHRTVHLFASVILHTSRITNNRRCCRLFPYSWWRHMTRSRKERGDSMIENLTEADVFEFLEKGSSVYVTIPYVTIPYVTILYVTIPYIFCF
jgi:hypothetical protein